MKNLTQVRLSFEYVKDGPVVGVDYGTPRTSFAQHAVYYVGAA
jgi:hypothetical protein